MQDQDIEKTAAEKPVSLATKINYGIGATGKSLSHGISGKNQYVYQHVMGMHMGFLSALYFLGRIWDGVNDLLMGTIIDNTRSKYGKFRPWIALGAFTNAIVTIVMLWSPTFDMSKAMLGVWIAIFYILWDATYTMVDVGYYAMIPALSLNSKERDQLSMIPRVFSGAVGIIGAFQNLILETIGGGKEPQQMGRGIFVYAVLSSAVYAVTSLYSAAVVKEPGIDTPKINQEKFSLRRAAGILVRNDQTMVTVGVMILFNWANNLTNGGIDSYFLWELGDTGKQGFFNIISGAAGAIGLFAIPFISRIRIMGRSLGRKKIYLATFFTPLLGYIIMAAAVNLAPGSFAPLAVSACITSIGYGSMGVMQGVMLADSVDYGEFNTGVRNEGIIFSTLTMLSKLAKAFGDATGAGVSWATKFGGQYESVFTPLAGKGFRALMYQMPPVLLLLALGLYLWKYRLHPDKMEEIHDALLERRALNPDL